MDPLPKDYRFPPLCRDAGSICNEDLNLMTQAENLSYQAELQYEILLVYFSVQKDLQLYWKWPDTH